MKVLAILWHRLLILQVLNTAYVILASLCTLLGVLGYKMYGSGVLDVVTFNLPKVSLSCIRTARIQEGKSFNSLIQTYLSRLPDHWDFLAWYVRALSFSYATQMPNPLITDRLCGLSNIEQIFLIEPFNYFKSNWLFKFPWQFRNFIRWKSTNVTNKTADTLSLKLSS